MTWVSGLDRIREALMGIKEKVKPKRKQHRSAEWLVLAVSGLDQACFQVCRQASSKVVKTAGGCLQQEMLATTGLSFWTSRRMGRKDESARKA